MQLLVRVVDRISKDPTRNLQLTKRGDVIAVKPDDADWGTEELTNPEWRIISVPDMTAAEAAALMTQELPPLGNPGQPVMKRAFRLDLDALAAQGVGIDQDRTVVTPADALALIAAPMPAPAPAPLLKKGQLAAPTLATPTLAAIFCDVATDSATIATIKLQKPASIGLAVIGVSNDAVIG